MKSSWRMTTFREVVTSFRGGSSFLKNEYTGHGDPVITKGDVKPFGRLIFSENKYIDSDLARKNGYPYTSEGDLIVATRDLSVEANFLGLVAPVPSGTRFLVNQGANIFRLDSNKILSKYFVYWSNSNTYRSFIKGAAVGSTQIHLRKEDFFDAPLLLPPLDDQENIVAALSSLDGKIDLNLQINQTLEQIAQTIFKSWFVDFEPVKAKIEANAAGHDSERAAMCAISGILELELDQLPPEQYQQLAAAAALFPDELVESELGVIPNGWEVGTLADLCILNAKSWGTKTMPAQVHYVDLANTKNGEILEVQIFSAEEAPSRARRILRSGDTIVGTVRPGNRSFALIGSSCPTLTGSTGFAVLSPKNEKRRELVYLLATGEANIGRLTRLADGAAYPAVRPEVVVDEQCVIPSDELVGCFHQVVGPIFDQRVSSAEASETLATLRNTLLPKLLSGELVSNIDDSLLVEQGQAI